MLYNKIEVITVMKNIYLIGNAHLDPVWLWQWQEGFAEIKATFRSALDRMKEFDDYKFTSACGAYYMWIEKSDKAMFEEIQQRVKEGRWCITGGWLIQPDCNAPDGESFFAYSIFPFTTPSDATKKAQMLNVEPQCVVETFHNGKLGTRFSGIGVDKENIIVSAIKKHEDSDAITIRCYEADNVDTTAKIKVFDTEFEARFGHNEIKTFVIDGKTVKETNLIEW